MAHLVGGFAGLEALLTDVTVIATKLICWGCAIQLYFMATMSPIPCPRSASGRPAAWT